MVSCDGPQKPPEDPPRLFCTFETIPHIPYCLMYFYYSTDSGVSSGYLVSGLSTGGERNSGRLRRSGMKTQIRHSSALLADCVSFQFSWAVTYLSALLIHSLVTSLYVCIMTYFYATGADGTKSSWPTYKDPCNEEACRNLLL